MHAPYNLFNSYKDPIKNNINNDSYVYHCHFGIFKMIVKLILFFYIFAIIEGENERGNSNVP